MTRRPAKSSASTPPAASARPQEQRAALDIERLRAQRVRPERSRSLAELLDTEHRAIDKAAKAIGPGGQAWIDACPPDHLPSTTVLGLQRGTLKIGVAGTATRFALDRWLRSGGERLIIRAARVAIRRITLVPHTPESEARTKNS